MEAEKDEICPVCTLYLRPGITLKSHLNSHPKQKVIEALVNLANLKSDNKCLAVMSEIACQPQNITRPVWNQPATHFPTIPMPTTNHSFIYQQFMTTSQPPLSPKYITIPTVFNSSVVCPPYLYQQQQQVFMASSALEPNIIRSNTPVIDLSLKDDGYESQQKEIIDEAGKDDANEDVLMSDYASPLEFESVEDDAGDKDEMADSPCSNSDYLRIRQDLNKACQTRQELENFEEDDELEDMSGNVKYYSDDGKVDDTNDQVLDLNGVKLVLSNDFIGSQVISQVHDFECNNEQPVLMNIGNNYDNNCSDKFIDESYQEDNLSQESGTNLSIRANENMPPMGELSGQESNGAASDITWNRVQYDSNSATSYDLFARETWEGSDGSNCEEVPMHEIVTPPGEDDTPTIINIIEAPLNFKCPTCGKGFKCPKERKTHQSEEHNKTMAEKYIKSGVNLIGAKVPCRTIVKKLVIKPKKTVEIKNEHNFDELFNNNKGFEGGSNVDDAYSKVALKNVENGDLKCNAKEDDGNALNCFVCSICGIVQGDLRSLKQHRQFAHPFSNRYKCDTCGEGMKDQKDFKQHLKKHPLECKLCGKYFYRRQNIQLHMKRHLGIKPFVCEFCEKGFFSKQKLCEHRNIHTGEAPIKCNMCDETFRRHSNLVQHRNIHHFNIKKKVKDYICHCGEVLHSKKKLAWHKEIHDAKPKACTKCSEKFIHMASLTRHMRRSHNERFVPEETRSAENVECPICQNVYLKSSLEAHIRRHGGEKRFSCSICNKGFSTKWNLKLHKWIHASRASKPFKCEHCKAAFIRESDFTAHMNSHKCVRPYTCNHCGAQFIRKSNCQRHVKEHEREKTFMCQLCGKAFHRSYYLKDHMRVHSGVRPYVCHICGKTSTTKSNHNKHVMIHHAKEPVSTEN